MSDPKVSNYEPLRTQRKTGTLGPWPPVAVTGRTMQLPKYRAIERIVTHLASLPECKLHSDSGYAVSELMNACEIDSMAKTSGAMFEAKALGLIDYKVGTKKTYSIWLKVDPVKLPFDITPEVELLDVNPAAPSMADLDVIEIDDYEIEGSGDDLDRLRQHRDESQIRYDDSDLRARENALRVSGATPAPETRENNVREDSDVPVIFPSMLTATETVDYTGIAIALLDEVCRLAAIDVNPDTAGNAILEAEIEARDQMEQKLRARIADLERDLSVAAGRLKSTQSHLADSEARGRLLEKNMEAAISAAQSVNGRTERTIGIRTRQEIDRIMRERPNTPQKKPRVSHS